MTLNNFLRWLNELREHGLSGDAEVKTYCPEQKKDVPITGAVYGDDEISFRTDEPCSQ